LAPYWFPLGALNKALLEQWAGSDESGGMYPQPHDPPLQSQYLVVVAVPPTGGVEIGAPVTGSTGDSVGDVVEL